MNFTLVYLYNKFLVGFVKFCYNIDRQCTFAADSQFYYGVIIQSDIILTALHATYNVYHTDSIGMYSLYP